jgi:hypothetical protein
MFGVISFNDPAHCLLIEPSQCPNTIKGFTPMVAVLTQRTLTTAINRNLISKSDRYPITSFFIIFPEIFWKLFRETFFFGAVKPHSTVLTRSRWNDLLIVRENWRFLARKAKCQYARILINRLFLTSRLHPLVYHLLQEALINRWIAETDYSTLANYCFHHPGAILQLLNLFFLEQSPPPLTIRRAAWWRLRARALT